MRHTPDDILSFAEMLIYGTSEPWGQFWTQSEIDGFFYNEFIPYLGLPFSQVKHILRSIRTRFLGQTEPPNPHRWDDPGVDVDTSTYMRKPELSLRHRSNCDPGKS